MSKAPIKTSEERKQLLQWLALELLAEWGLTPKGWVFRWSTTKRSFGRCFGRKKIIELSLYLLPTISDEEAEDTIRHEIAHALDNEERGTSDHSWRWKAWAIKVGARPQRTSKSGDEDVKKELAYQSKYRLECPNGCLTPSHKRKRRMSSCGPCGNGRYNEALQLKQIENHPDNIPAEYGGNVKGDESRAAA